MVGNFIYISFFTIVIFFYSCLHAKVTLCADPLCIYDPSPLKILITVVAVNVPIKYIYLFLVNLKKCSK